MSIIGLNLGSTRAFESTHDPDKGQPEATKFVLTTLDSRVMGKIRDRAATMRVDPTRPDDEVDTSINIEDVNFMTAQFGITGWENFRGHNGEDIDFKSVGRRLAGKSYVIVDPEVLARVPLAIIREIADEIRKDNELDEQDEKKSDAQ